MAPSWSVDRSEIHDLERASLKSSNHDGDDTEGQDTEYSVEDILAERANPDDPGETQYLIKWENYELCHCTWEPAEHLGPGLLEQWQETKARVEAGQEEPYDIELYYAACRPHEEKNTRKQDQDQERDQRRWRLSQLLQPEALVQDDCSNNDAKETQDADSASLPPRKKSKPISKPKTTPKTLLDKPIVETSGAHIVNKEKPKQKRTPALPPKPAQKPREEKRTVPDQGKGKTGATTTGYRGTARAPTTNTSPTASKAAARGTLPQKAPASTPKTPSSNTVSKKPSVSAPKPSPKQPPRSSTSLATKFRGGKRLTATRTKPLPAETPARTTNVLIGGKVRKKRTNLIDAMDDPSKTPKAFSTLHVMNVAKKRGNERNDAAPPTFESIPSSFILNNDQNSRAKAGQTKTNVPSAAPGPSTFVESPAAVSPSDVNTGASTLKAKKSVSFAVAQEDVPEDEVMGDGIDDIFGETATMGHPSENLGPTNDSSPPRQLSPATNEDSRQTQVVAKTVAFGKANSDCIRVLFSGIVRKKQPWLDAFVAQEALGFDTVCSSSYFISHKSSLVEEILSAGAIEYVSDEILPLLQNVAANLRRQSFASHMVAERFSILVYPSQCDDWNGLNLEKFDTESPLRYIIYRSSSDVRLYPPASVPRAPARLVDIKGGSHCELLMNQLFGLDFSRFLPQNPKDKDKQVYMLVFHPKEAQVCRMVKLWLRSCHPNCRIFSHEIDGSWAKFHETVRSGAAGTIILHEDVTVHIRQIPRIYQMVDDNRSYTFWNLATGQYNPPRFPSELFITIEPGTLEMTRLFPHGRAFLITPSFALSDPIRLCQFLEWFKDYCCNPHYLIIACADFPNYLKAVALEKGKERYDMLTSQANNPNLEQLLTEAGLTITEFEARFKAWEILQTIMKEFGDNHIDEEIRKVHWATNFFDVNDEQSLVNWFCYWSATKLDRYRKFTVLGSSNSRNTAAYRRIDIPFYTDETLGDPDQSRLRDIQMSQGKEAKEAAACAKEHPQDATAAADLNIHSATKLRNWISSIQDYHRRKPNWARLHANPVSWLDVAMADHFGDPRFQYDTFNNWLGGVLAAPGANTLYGLFYTIDKPWNPDVHANAYGRHPWIAIVRPANPHLPSAAYSKMQLFIWDVSAHDRERIHGHSGVLLDMQKRLVDTVREGLPAKYPHLHLDDVYVGSETNFEVKPGDDLTDLTCRRIDEMMANGRVSLPPFDNLLPERGWKPLARPEWKHGMVVGSSGVLDAQKERGQPRKPHNTDGRIPSSIFYAPAPKVKVVKSKCVNYLYEASQAALARDESCQMMRYQYKSTLDWYHDMKTEGRDASHAHVDSADRILAKLLYKK
ncbi:hypothetical protein GGS26DRAFT_595008 [Hypomontagnella submonticulosa]|nr:hypothetical protein GGS26DRAFT_595008 [Hypomontagnella submonticulosa]